MEGVEGESSGASNYSLRPSRINNEDILFCIDVDPESLVEMKVSGPNGRPFTRLDSIKQAILLFINAKLTINPDHRFAFATLGKSPSWVTLSFSFPFCLVPEKIWCFKIENFWVLSIFFKIFFVCIIELLKIRMVVFDYIMSVNIYSSVLDNLKLLVLV